MNPVSGSRLHASGSTRQPARSASLARDAGHLQEKTLLGATSTMGQIEKGAGWSACLSKMRSARRASKGPWDVGDQKAWSKHVLRTGLNPVTSSTTS